MNSFQLAYRSIIRKPIKSLLLLLVVFVMSLFLLSSLATKNASIATQDTTRQAIGAGIVLEGNEANRHTRINDISKEIGEGIEGSLDGFHQKKVQSMDGSTAWQVWTDNSFETLKLEDIEKISSVSGISQFNIATVTTAVNPVNFTRIEELDVDQSTDKKGVSLIGNKNMELNTNVLSGNLSIKEGRMTSDNDIDVCVISEELALQNDLQIGNVLTFNDYHNREHSTIYEAEIIGIYHVEQAMTPYMNGDTYRSENVIFTDLRFPEKAEGNDQDPLFEKAYFKVENVNEYDVIKNSIKQINLDWSRYDLIDNNGNLDTMSQNFNSLESMSELLIWIIACASFVILFLVFVFWIKNRVLEVGVFLSLGLSKLQIISQILLEAWLIAIVAITISFATAPIATTQTAYYMVNQQVELTNDKQASEAGKVATGRDGIDTETANIKILDVHAEITASMMIWDGIAILFLISSSVIIASFTIIKKKPKDILSDLS